MSDSKLITWALVAIAVLAGIFLLIPEDDVPEPGNSITTTRPDPLPEPEPLPEVEVESAPEPAQVVVDESPAPVPPPVTPEPEPEPEPEPAPEAVEERRPTLNTSDGHIREELAEISGGSRLLSLLTTDEIIRKLVVFTENASRGTIPTRNLPVAGPGRSMTVREISDPVYVMEPSSFDRFNMMVSILTSIDTEQALALYRDLEPLFDQAYAEIGYPQRRFTDTLIDAIDNVLEARIMEGPFRLRRPSVMYEFEDPRLESLSQVEKLILRLGPENAANLQEKLRQFRSALQNMR